MDGVEGVMARMRNKKEEEIEGTCVQEEGLHSLDVSLSLSLSFFLGRGRSLLQLLVSPLGLDPPNQHHQLFEFGATD